MSSTSTMPPAINTLADLLDLLGDIPLNRIRYHPYPGTATLRDVIDAERNGSKLCELVEGVLVEKAVGYMQSGLAGYLLGILNAFVIPRNLGVVTGSDGTVELMPGLVRIPDIAFTSWDRLPGRRYPTAPIPRLSPNLAVEVLSRGNTVGEMALKRQHYFTSGVELVWEIDPVTRSVVVYTSVSDFITLSSGDMLDGGTVLPGFVLPVQTLFAEIDRHD